MIAYARGGYNPNLRMTRRQSVEALSPGTMLLAPKMNKRFVYTFDENGVRLWTVEGDCLGTLQRKSDETTAVLQAMVVSVMNAWERENSTYELLSIFWCNYYNNRNLVEKTSRAY